MTPRPEHLGLGETALQVTLAGRAILGPDRDEICEAIVNGVGWLEMPRYIVRQAGDRNGLPWYPQEEAFLLRRFDLGNDPDFIARLLRRGVSAVKTKLGRLLVERRP